MVIVMEAPICLINTTENGKLLVNPEAINILRKINQRLVVVSIVGMLQTGKSYLMDKLARAQSDSRLGFTSKSKTKGIWMWCVPHPTEDNQTLVLLDTEGLGDEKEGDNRNYICIFSLAVLLSSMLVYNSKGIIDQDAINKLEFVSELSSFIKVKSQENDDEEAEYSSHFPIFIWAVRDFQLGLMIDGKTVTEDEYLENALKLKKPVKSIRDQDYNRVRQQLHMYFGKRKCFVFDLPTANKQHIRRLEYVPDSDLSADFVTQRQKFCDYIFSEGIVKRMKQIFPVTGPRLGELTKMYTEALNSSNCIYVEKAVVSLADNENEIAIQEATQHYQSKMNEVVFPTETLNQFLEKSRQHEDKAKQIFLTKCFQGDDQRYRKKYEEIINKQTQDFKFRNEAKSLEICGALIKNLSVDFEKALAEGAYIQPGGHGKFKQDLKTIEIKYNNAAGKGLKAKEVLQAYLKSKEGNEAKIIEKDNALSQREKEEKEEKIRKYQEQMRQMEEALTKQKADEEKAKLEEKVSIEIKEPIRQNEQSRRKKEKALVPPNTDEEQTKKKIEVMEEKLKKLEADQEAKLEKAFKQVLEKMEESRTMNKKLQQVIREQEVVKETLQEFVKYKQAFETIRLMLNNTKKEKEQEDEKLRRENEELQAKLRALHESIKQLTRKMEEEKRTMNEKLGQVIREKEEELQRQMREMREMQSDLNNTNKTCCIIS